MGRLRRAWTWTVATAALWAPALAAASEAAGEGGGRNPWVGLLLKFVNFAILVGILYFALRKSIPQALADRRENIRRALEEARRAKEEAEAKLQRYKERVARLEDEIRRLKADFEAEGRRQHERILAEAERAAEALKRQAESAAENELKRARDALRTDAAELAVRLAEEILRKAYTLEDQKKAVSFTVQRIEELH